VNGGSFDDGDSVYRITGERYSLDDVDADWAEASGVFKRALVDAPWPQRYDSFTKAGEVLDHMSIPEWLDVNVTGGAGGRLGQLLQTVAISEYGGEPAKQPALNLIYVLAWNPGRSIEPLAGTDEMFHIAGGNDLLISRMAEEIPQGSINTNTALIAVNKQSTDSYVCTFQSDAATFDVRAEYVVLALPFTTLREVDLAGAGLSDLKLRAIREMAMGTNAKLHIQVGSRPWAGLGLGGVAFTDPAGFQVCWDETAAQPGESGILVNFTGGEARGQVPQEPDEFLSGVEPLFPGTAEAYQGLSWTDLWAASPWQKGSYSHWGLGQYSAFAGYEGASEGNVHFCGEHTSQEFQGYMEGAVETAEDVARSILTALS
ncbi:MAG: flavin monoamine oxidase family protein, partial [Acidimicrobiia bacterium]